LLPKDYIVLEFVKRQQPTNTCSANRRQEICPSEMAAITSSLPVKARRAASDIQQEGATFQHNNIRIG
jgi:hypothetical protein